MEDKEKPIIPTTKEEFLARLPAAEQENIKKVARIFTEAMKAQGERGYLLAVGGAVEREWPRKDIDLAVVLELAGGELKRTPYRQATEDFVVLERIAEELVREGFQIQERQEPALDHEYDSENFLRHSGSITLESPEGGVPVELFVRTYEQVTKKPYVLLAKFPGEAGQNPS